MAEAHPVAFQWVMEAKARGATVIHVDPHYSRTSALADMFVPLRAGTDIAFLGGIINHVLTTESDFREYVLALHQRADDRPRGVRGRRRRRAVLGLRPRACAAMTPRAGSTRARSSPPRRASATRRATSPVRARAERVSAAATRAARPSSTRRSQHPRCVWQILKRHYAALHARDGGAGVRRPAGRCSPRSASCSSPTRDASARPRSCTAWAGRSTRSARSTSAPPRSCSCCSGNMGRPGGGVMAMRGHASIQGSSDIPTLFDTLPGYIPMPHAHAHEDLDEFIAGDARRQGLLGQHARLHREPAEGVVGRGGDRRERLLLRLPAAADRKPQHLRHGDGADRRDRQGVLPVRPEPGGGLGQHAACSGSGCPSSTGSWSATSR